MDLSSPWFSVLPLLVVNGVFLIGMLVFRRVYRESDRNQEVEGRPSSKLVNKWVREYWLWLTDPLVRLFVRLKFTPNLLTLIGILISLASAYFFALGFLGVGGWLMIFAATFDIFDGRVARITHNETRSGAYFDSVVDRISEGAAFAGLAYFYRWNAFGFFLVVMALLGSFLVSYARAKGEAQKIYYDGGSMQRPERIVYLGVGAIFSPLVAWLFSLVSSFSYFELVYFLYLLPVGFVALMTWITSANRIKTTMKLLDKESS